MSKSTTSAVLLELGKLAAWLENPQESMADRSNPYRIAATIRGILAAHEAAESRSADLGDVRVSPNQNDKNPAQPPTCPICGFVMCEEFDYKRVNNRQTLAVPNGQYSCVKCKSRPDR